MIIDHVMYEVRSDEAAATGHDDVPRGKGLFCHAPDFTTPYSHTTLPYFFNRGDISRKPSKAIFHSTQTYSHKSDNHIMIRDEVLTLI
ncbi:hypothetical protein F6S84_08700 [Bifidobacterium dentium]|nr:hypothetical protein [Bifidobacterium dentium]NEG53724.1 hypothetical protein [Bifidobacterium dentium]